MRVAVIGCGSIGRRHIGNLLALGCDVFGVDTSLNALSQIPVGAKEFWIAPYSGFAPNDFDALVIATPYDKHLDWVESAVYCRVPFFVEKPLGSLEQLPRWRELAAMDLPVHQVGYQLRFNGVAKALRDVVPRPERGVFVCHCDSRTWPGGAYGPMLLECSHEIDLALYFGAPAVVTSAAYDGRSCVDVDLGGVWHVTLNDRADEYYRRWRLHGHGNSGRATFHSPETLGDEMYRDEMEYFLNRVLDGHPSECPLADGLRVLEVCRQIERLSSWTYTTPTVKESV